MDAALSDAIVARIYEGVVDEAGWAESLALAARATHSAQALLVMRNTAAANVFRIIESSATSERAVRDYNQHFYAIDPALAVIDQVPEGSWYLDRVHLGEAAIARSPFYQDYLRPMGLGCVAAPRLAAGAHLEAYVSLQRGLDQKPFEPAELDALAPVLAHLRRAVRLRTRVEDLSDRAAFGSRLLDAVRVPAFVADAKGRVRAFNPRAECRLDRGDREVTVRAGRLQMPAAAQRLAHALSRACGHQGPAVADAFQLWRGQGLAPLQVVVTPLPVGMDPARHAPQPLALVLLQDPAEPLEACEGVLQSLYGMTPAEARVAAAIVRGATPAAAAQALGVRLPTVRTQLKAVFLKAGVDGQGELVRRLAPLLVVGQ